MLESHDDIMTHDTTAVLTHDIIVGFEYRPLMSTSDRSCPMSMAFCASLIIWKLPSVCSSTSCIVVSLTAPVSIVLFNGSSEDGDLQDFKYVS